MRKDIDVTSFDSDDGPVPSYGTNWREERVICNNVFENGVVPSFTIWREERVVPDAVYDDGALLSSFAVWRWRRAAIVFVLNDGFAPSFFAVFRWRRAAIAFFLDNGDAPSFIAVRRGKRSVNRSISTDNGLVPLSSAVVGKKQRGRAAYLPYSLMTPWVIRPLPLSGG